MKTIEEARETKRDIEQQIAKLLDNYYKTYECVVDSINITQIIGIDTPVIYKIDLDVKL